MTILCDRTLCNSTGKDFSKNVEGEKGVLVLVETDMTFSQRLHELKEASGLSWPAIAKRSGLSMNSLNDYAHKGKVPSALVLFKIAKAMGISCDQFSMCEEDKPAKKKRK